MKNIVQIGFYHDLYLGIFSMIKAYSMGKKHPCFFFFCCWCDWGSGEESSLKMKVAHVFSGGSASRIFHETSLSLVKIPRPAPPPYSGSEFVRIPPRLYVSGKTSNPAWDRLHSLSISRSTREPWSSYWKYLFRTNIPFQGSELNFLQVLADISCSLFLRLF